MESPTYEDFTRSYANKLSKDELINELVFYASKYHKILQKNYERRLLDKKVLKSGQKVKKIHKK